MMKRLIFLAAFVLAGAGWVEGTRIGVPTDNSKRPVVFFVSTETTKTHPDIPIPPDQWITIDLASGPQWPSDLNQPDLPFDTMAVFLSGKAIITYRTPDPSTGTYICEVWATFRAPGDDLPPEALQVHAIETSETGGQRSNAALWVPVVDRKFEVYWHHTLGCPSALNFSLQAYVR